ncbi:hypothetical protein QYF36_005022 [Acer negundo]|nr:hypothetical protein QYF36_005022 [Acer negundo]
MNPSFRVALAIHSTTHPDISKPEPTSRRQAAASSTSSFTKRGLVAIFLDEKRTRRFLRRPHRLVGRFWLQSRHPAAPPNLPPPSIRLLPATSFQCIDRAINYTGVEDCLVA